MPYLRGLNTEDRIGVSLSTVTADASLVLNQCLVYSATVCVIDSSATAHATIADSSASGAGADKETSKMEIHLGGASAADGDNRPYTVYFKPAWHVQNTLVADITNATVSVSFKDLEAT